MTGLAGFLLAKCATAHSRRTLKDWYDIAFVLLHDDAGGPEAAAQAVLDRFGRELARVRTALADPAPHGVFRRSFRRTVSNQSMLFE